MALNAFHFSLAPCIYVTNKPQFDLNTTQTKLASTMVLSITLWDPCLVGITTPYVELQWRESFYCEMATRVLLFAFPLLLQRHCLIIKMKAIIMLWLLLSLWWFTNYTNVINSLLFCPSIFENWCCSSTQHSIQF